MIDRRDVTRLLGTALLFLLLHSGIASAQPETAPSFLRDTVRGQLRTRIEAERRGLDALDAKNDVVRASNSVIRFYEQRGFNPVWIGSRGPRPTVDSLLAALRRVDRDGLRPTDYHIDAIDAIRQTGNRLPSDDVGRWADLELLCTDAFLLYASHLLTGRVSATEMTPTWNVSGRQADLLQKLHEATSTGSVSTTLQSLRPSQPDYAALTDALQRYRAIARNGGWTTIPDGPTMEHGSTGVRITRLRRRLATTGDLSSAHASVPPDSVASFDAALEAAVVRFQKRHGLDPDGIVGPATRAALNVPVEERIQQLAVNLERWRWLPQDLGRRYIVVNIAGFSLRVMVDDSEVMSMPVVTGRPYRQTPVFSGEISYLVFNPYWHVPHSIAIRDKLPEIQKDPGYLSRQGFKVFQGWSANAQPIDPSTIDWASLSRSHFPYRLRQDPGPLNALGRVKFMFPNPHSVYLHDTPSRGLFARAERSFSSGCIRLERPLDLAEYLLSDQTQWTRERIQSVVTSSTTEQTVVLHEPVPVHLQYWTAWVEDDGIIHFRSDVYNRDAAIQRALTAAPPADS